MDLGGLDIYEEGFEEAYEALTWTKNEHSKINSFI